MFAKLLVIPVSAEPEQAVMRRARQCAGDATQIEVFDVAYEPLLEGYFGNQAVYEPLRGRVLAERGERAEALAESLAAPGRKTSGRAVWDHPWHRVVADEVRATGADLVIAAPQRGPAGALTHGDWQLVLTCPVPVLVVRSDGAAAYRKIVAAIDPFHEHAKPLDLDAEILRQAVAAQQLTGAAMTVRYCYTPLTYFGADLGTLPPVDPRLEERRREALRDVVVAGGLPAGAARLDVGPAHAVLEDLIDTHEADLVVMGAVARGRLKELLIGSTAERVLEHGGADVLVVKPPGGPAAP
jgi:universal stress protein E